MKGIDLQKIQLLTNGTSGCDGRGREYHPLANSGMATFASAIIVDSPLIIGIRNLVQRMEMVREFHWIDQTIESETSDPCSL